jgi:hypothetical protein
MLSILPYTGVDLKFGLKESPREIKNASKLTSRPLGTCCMSIENCSVNGVSA